MCGIAGFTDHPADRPGVLAAMTAAMRHRGPQQEDFFLDARLAFGHRRLVIIEPDGGEQPRVDAASGDALVYNGEIFDYRRHLAELRGAGAPLRDGCDTEVLFATLRRHGVEGALARLDGAFAFAYREAASGRLHLAVDRMGEKPLYYLQDGDDLIFASELGALRCHPRVAALPLDPLAFCRALAFEYCPGEAAVIRGVRRLGPGQRALFERGRLTVETYWRPRFVASGTARGSFEGRLTELERQLESSIRARLIADVPVGVFLSGGVDSSLIAALAAKHAPGIKAFTVKPPHESQDSAALAGQVAAKLAVTHRVIPLTDGDLLAAVAAIEQRLDEPFADSSLIPGYLACQVAKSEVTVALGGDGADELLGGHPFLARRWISPLLTALPRGLGRGLRRILAGLPAGRRLRFRGEQLLRGAGETPALQPFLWLSAFDGTALGRLATPALRATLAGADLLAPLRDPLAQLAGLPPGERLQSLWLASYLPWDGAAKLDRMAMWNSFEIRAPFLARELVDYCLTLPAADRVRGGETKFLLKTLAARHVPPAVVWRPKQGFVPPLAEYLRGPLARQVEARLLDPGNPLQAWFDRGALARLWRAHRDGRADHRRALWGLYLAFGWAARTRPALPCA